MNKKRTLLIAEDSKVNRKILKRILEAEGYDTLEAENGQIALDLLQSGKYEISLVLLDLTMPVMNGYELLAKMKESGLLTSVPVIVTTGSEKGMAEIRSLECGASDFIAKPYNAEIIIHRVESILRLCDNAALINELEIDLLTGVYSREAFYRHAQMMLEENPDEKYDIVCSNIENFKMINSKYGITVGDELLRCIAAHNIACIGPDGICGRIGADSFVVLRKSRSLRSQEEIGQLYSQTFQDAPVKNFVMQYGVYPISDRSASIASMCDCAQIALSSIKHKYGMYYAVYDDSMRQKILREHQLTGYMELALAEKQFVVYLQPKHDVQTGRIAGAEALVRWFHPELGFISPGEFIPLFERNGFVAKLDRYVWEVVCTILQGWMKEGRPLIPISANASRVDFDADDLPETISELVDSYGIPHNMLHFEVTESAYTDNPQKMIAAVSMLRSMGFLIEMDDFGSGYSSLNMLSELPIDILKLDMRFIQKGSGLLPNSKRSILSFIVSLSKWLQLPTIAEGVETKEEVELLRSMGCNYIQGFYFAKPMPVADFEKYMTDAKNAPSLQAVTTPKSSEIPTTFASGENMPCVLIVEDIESNRELLKEILKPYYKIVTACDGAQAYALIQTNHAKLSCILLDLLMPVMDGFQLIDAMRKDGFLDEIPVIITSEVGSDSELRALHLDADSFVSKPYNAEILLHHVKKAVNERDFRKLRLRV
ncbi:MAG: EAL domain-containing protein [Oscillospiraceae bacterium]|nr:EAL domain-containing protein [Oscillospiraceae bacterium]